MKSFLSLCLLSLCLLLTACQLPDRSEERLRPYGVGANFLVHADSLLLQEERPMHWCQGVAETSDSLFVFRQDPIVIAAITVIPEDCVDSVWVKVARDQGTMGWTHESNLLAAICPDDPISLCILFISHLHASWLLAAFTLLALLLVLYVPHFAPSHRLHLRLPTFTPVLFFVNVGLSALLYQFILRHTPDAWAHFYFNPTLNPFSQPLLLCLFLSSIWAALLLFILCVDDVLRLLPVIDAALYLTALLGLCSAILLLAQWLSPLLFLPLWLLASAAAVLLYWRHARPRYFCGQCGAPLQEKGPCPLCGAIND